MSIDLYHVALMEHCVGMDNHKPYRRHGRLFFRPRRNYFDCGPADEPYWREIEACGYAVDFDGRGWFKLTRDGFRHLSEATGINVHDDLAYEGEDHD